MLGMSTVTTRSTSRRMTSGATRSWPPGSDRNDSGSAAGAAKLTSTVLPHRSSTKASASPAPIVAASGWTWQTTAIVAAASSTLAAPTASTRCVVELVFEFVVVTGAFPVSGGCTYVFVILLRPAHPVGIGVTGRRGSLTHAGHIGVGGARPGQQFLHSLHGVGHRVAGEGQRGSEPHAGAGSDLAAQHTLGAFQRRSGAFVIGRVFQRRPHHRVVQRRVVQIAGHLGVDDRYAGQSRIFDLVLDRRGDDFGDPFREPARPRRVTHTASSTCRSSYSDTLL